MRFQRTTEPQERTVSAFEDDVLGDADAVEIARRIAAREIQAHEAVDAAIRRSEKVNPALNAIVTPVYEEARKAARRPATGALAGVPSFIKDTDEVAGAPTRVGSRAVPATPSKKTSSFAKQFLSTGLVNLGKTSTPEFGLTGTTEPVLLGPTHNPWRLGFSPGGSSGGSAALVAAGVVPLAHANDGAGSIRVPASCCGLVGLKPSRGRVAFVDGSWLLPINILHQGVVSRSVRDTIAFYGAAEAYHRNPKLPPIGTITGPGRRLRVGCFYDPGSGRTTHPEVRAAAENAARLCEGLGHSVEEIPNPYPQGFHRDFFLLWALMAFVVTRAGKLLVHPQFDRHQVEPLAEDLSLLLRRNVRGIIPAIRRLRRAAREYHRIFEQYDVLLNPTLGTLPPEHGYLGPEVPFKVALKRMGDFFPFTPLQNISGTPAITLPLGTSESGLPIGVQFASPMGDEQTLLELALELEQAAPWPSLNRHAGWTRD